MTLTVTTTGPIRGSLLDGSSDSMVSSTSSSSFVFMSDRDPNWRRFLLGFSRWAASPDVNRNYAPPKTQTRRTPTNLENPTLQTNKHPDTFNKTAPNRCPRPFGHQSSSNRVCCDRPTETDTNKNKNENERNRIPCCVPTLEGSVVC